jgi:hypothetical protein
MNYTICEYHLAGLPNHISSLLMGLTFTHSFRGRRRLPDGSFTPKCRYIRILRNQRSEALFLALIEDGFFDFFCTNNGFGIYLHQLVCFYSKGGWQAWHYLGITAPQGDYDCHHINGNTLDNRPCNLVILSTYDHKIVTAHQRGAGHSRVARHTFDPNNSSPTLFNRQGRLIQNHEHFLANIIALTLYLTCEWVFGFRGYLRGQVQWVERIIGRLLLGLDSTLVPNPQYLPI